MVHNVRASFWPYKSRGRMAAELGGPGANASHKSTSIELAAAGFSAYLHSNYANKPSMLRVSMLPQNCIYIYVIDNNWRSIA